MSGKCTRLDIGFLAASLAVTLSGDFLYSRVAGYGTVWNMVCGLLLAVLFLRFKVFDRQVLLGRENLLLSAVSALSFYLTLRQRLSTGLTWCAILLLFVCSMFLFPALKKAIAALPRALGRCELLKGHPYPAAVFVFLYALAAMGLFWRHFFPYGYSPDVLNQLDQIHGVIAYSDVHAIGHTLFLKALLSIWDDLGFVVAVQLVMVAFLFALMTAYFTKKGIPFTFCLLLTGIFHISCAVLKPYVTPWKDTPYLFCVGLLSWLLMRRQEEGEEKGWIAVLMGLALAGILLFRLNGIVIFLFTGICLFLDAVRNKRRKTLLLTFSAFVFLFGGVQFYAYRVLHTQSPVNGFSVQVFGTAIAAAVMDGRMTEEEYAAVTEQLPAAWIEEKYRDWQLGDLLWGSDYTPLIEDDPDMEVFNNTFVVSMGAHKKEVIALYFQLLPRHWLTYLKNIVQGTRIIWGHEGFSKAVLVFDHVALVMYLYLAGSVFIKPLTGAKGWWLPFMPAVMNTLSIAISTVTNEERYLLPMFALWPMLFCYILSHAAAEKKVCYYS
ncbi:MAG: hypothetical protein IJ600_08690 [Lachnospiraceae bacterium]|nr:hypothetical protein [Lachnospiraceae bacterium]